MSDAPTNSDIMRAIGSLEGTMSGVNKSLESHSDRMDSHSIRIDAQSTRIGGVENRQAWWAGAAAMIGIIGGFILKKIGI